MQTAIITALAAEVQGQFAAILANLADIETRAAATYAEAAKVNNDMNCSAASDADRDLAYRLNDTLDSVRRHVVNYQESIVRGVKDHDKAYAQIEERRLTVLNIEAAKTAEPVESGFRLLSAHIALSNGKPTSRAAVLYMIEGTVFEATVDATEGGFSIGRGWSPFEGVQVHGEKPNVRRRLFWGAMTPEEIGKAVDIRAKIIAAAKDQFDDLPRKYRR
ncbi:hypothetical protein [Agrobacterium tumefaciens]|uniref:hypothetical protein n=1 Tax=Agrobacterium tumefaciens TaxID=358 RepID=UPI0015726E15|nr:hypothetical protein [Agrobacterium tumefaciens]